MSTNSGVQISTARETLSRRFGFDGFREGQEAVIERLLGGRSVLAIFPTGGGKSLCYQLPSLMLDGLTLVISPLIALMKDQLDFLVARGVPAARLGLEPRHRRDPQRVRIAPLRPPQAALRFTGASGE